MDKFETVETPIPCDDSEPGNDLPLLIPSLTRQKTRVEEALSAFSKQSSILAQQLKEADEDECFWKPDLEGCVFVGHTATDMDSIGSALAAAELYIGAAARASEINSETAFALEYWEVEQPPRFEDIGTKRRVCLVDHNQRSQMNEHVEEKQIVGVIDHHALQQGTVVTDLPIHVDIRPWGSACTIMAHQFLEYKKAIPKTIAGLLLSGILSDTLNLRSPTSTEVDRLMVALLADIAGVRDIDNLAKLQFRAKSREFDQMSASALVTGDFKIFHMRCPLGYSNAKLGFGVIETIDTEGILKRKNDLLMECRATKAENHLEYMYLAVVNINELKTSLLICGSAEKLLAEESYGGATVDKILELGGRVSRKKTLVPPISKVLKDGWMPSEPQKLHIERENSFHEDFGEVIMHHTAMGCTLRRQPSVSEVLNQDFDLITQLEVQHSVCGRVA